MKPLQLSRQLAAAVALAATACLATAADWSSAGRDMRNSRHQADETVLTPANVGGLSLKWTVSTDGDVTAHPAADGEHLYFPDSAGFLYKVNRLTGALVWKRSVAALTGIPGDFARATPAIAGNLLIFGNQAGKLLGPQFGQPAPAPARVVAVNKHTGQTVWNTQVDDTVMSMVTNSAVVHNGVAYVGTASNEELVAAFVPKAYWQWHFRGAAVALDVATGRILWKSYMVPPGYHGGAIWSSTAAVEPSLGLLYVTTGNNYAVPDSVLNCLNAGGVPSACMSANNHFDSLVALDLKTGAVRWAGRGLPYDAWNVGCGLNVPGFFVPANDNCPNPAGPDYDFAQGAMLFRGPGAAGRNTLVGAGQKSGMFWAFDAATGKPAWSRQAAPGGVTGGLQWGSATDGRSIWVAAANAGDTMSGGSPKPWTLKNGSTTTAGGWAALNAADGTVLWTTPDPMGGRSEAPVSSANGIVFGCSKLPPGAMYALDAATGAVLWSFNSGAFCNAGATVVDGMVYWGSGNFMGLGAKKVFAFGL